MFLYKFLTYRIYIKIVYSFILLQSAIAFTAERCFENHLKEAVQINQLRAPLYSELSQGKSLMVSRQIINFEESLIFFNHLFFANYEKWAEPYNEKGIPILCEYFVSMKNVPSFIPKYQNGSPFAKDYLEIDPYILARNLSYIKKKHGLQALDEELQKWLLLLEKEPRLNCMLRHVLESIKRIIQFLPSQELRASNLNLSSPRWIAEKLISSHIMMISNFVKLDELAAPLNIEGLPILCQDVPKLIFSK